jgi:hypothetical protein
MAALYLLMYNRWRKQFPFFPFLTGRFDHSPTLEKSNEEKEEEEEEDFDLHSAPWCVGTWRRQRERERRDGSTANTFKILLLLLPLANQTCHQKRNRREKSLKFVFPKFVL